MFTLGTREDIPLDVRTVKDKLVFAVRLISVGDDKMVVYALSTSYDRRVIIKI